MNIIFIYKMTEETDPKVAEEEYENEELNLKSSEEFNKRYKLDLPYQDIDKVEKEIVLQVVKPEDRKTANIISLFEYAEVLASRSKQIESGSDYFIELNGQITPFEIAKEEILQKKCPLAIKRCYGDKCEIWGVNELIIPY